MIWQIGPHRIACGDTKDPELMQKLFETKKAKAVICDIPYGINYVQTKEGFVDTTVKKEIQNDDITDDTLYAKFNEDWIRTLLPYLASKNAIYIFNCDKMIFALREGMKNAGLYLSQLIV